MGSKTTNYQLNQWEANDSFLRTDFNEDNAKIESALTELNGQISGVGYVCGKYTGNGTYPRTISLGFQPTAVMLATRDGIINNSGTVFGGVFGKDTPLAANSTTNYAEVTTDGFLLKAGHINENGMVFNYIALR